MMMCSSHEDSVQQIAEDDNGGFDICDAENMFVYITPSKSTLGR